MNNFNVTTYAQLEAAFKSLVGNYDEAIIKFTPAAGGTTTYRLPRATKKSPGQKAARDERVLTYARNAGRLKGKAR